MRQIAAILSAAALAMIACQREAAPQTPAARVPAMPVAGTPLASTALASTSGARRIETDVRALADDKFEGRLTGSRGYALAADYVAARYRQIGLRPASDNGTYFQRVPLLQSVRMREGAQLVVHRHGRDIALRFGDQFLPAPGFNLAQATVTAPAVFVNQGIVAPGMKHNDLARIDLKGRIAVLFRGAPASFSNDQRALHGGDEDKLRQLAARGAVGVVFVSSAADEARAPWANVAAAWDRPAMRLRGEDGTPIDGFPQLRVIATVSATAADLLFADQPQSAAELFIRAQNGNGKNVALPGTLTLAADSRITPLDSRNVIALLPGSDPALGDAPVIISAHLDHLGLGIAVNGDAIYNGAIDNALGVAILLEAAQQLVADGAPKRPLLFLATTGEEQDLLGARWFAAHPPGGGAPVTDLNLDMPVLTAPTTDVVAVGAEHSSLQATLTAAAKQLGVAVSPDPYPEQDTFVRGDHYAFVRAGIPALYLTGGAIAADKTRNPKIALRYYLRNCYHRPCDDAAQPIRYDDAARLAQLAARMAAAIGNANAPTRWNPGDAFGTHVADANATD